MDGRQAQTGKCTEPLGQGQLLQRAADQAGTAVLRKATGEEGHNLVKLSGREMKEAIPTEVWA